MTLKSIVGIATSRWVKGLVFVLWMVSLLSVVTWVRESYQVTSSGSERRFNYFEVHRTALFVWLSLILFGYGAYHFKKCSSGWYGVVEVGVGVIGGLVAIARLPVNDAASWFALAASAYVIVRGAGNVETGLKEEETRRLAKQSALIAETLDQNAVGVRLFVACRTTNHKEAF